jgi:hypothetical protein
MDPMIDRIYNQMIYSDQAPEFIYKRDYWTMICNQGTPNQSHGVALASALRRVFRPLKRWTKI